jgi:peptidoglycan hydrolase-like protein with peptidoglycan-binding domain
MRQLLCKRSLRGLILAAVTAGTWTVPAASAQSTAAPTKKPLNKNSSGASTPASTSHATVKKTAHSTHGKTSSKSKKVKGQTAPTQDRINEIQEALGRRGAFTGSPTGQWDDSTVEAMKKFQTSNGLTPSGKLDALTLQKLGLGSEIAGLAAPTPPPNSANRLRNQTSAPVEPSN